MKCFYFLSLFALLMLASTPQGKAAAVPVLRIEKLLPFAGADAVRIETTLAAGSSGTVSLQGKITAWPQGATLWEGPAGHADLLPGQSATAVQQVSGLSPLLWDLDAPHLYTLTITASGPQMPPVSQSVRFGFRSFTTQNGQFLLNGRKIFLCGNSINPPGRGTAASVANDAVFARAYLRDLKSRNINMIRPGDNTEVWLDACDELGMMVFQGRYGAAPGGSRSDPPTDFDASIAAYKRVHFEQVLPHPSVVIDILSNEMPTRSKPYADYLNRAYRVLRVWDPNRLFIENAGFGHGKSGDINDQHPYSGWYNQDFLTYYRYRKAPPKVQPITFTETVAAYTGANGSFTIASKQLPPSLTWTGHTLTPAADSLAYQAFLTGQIVELQRRLRPFNPQLAGVMPFTGIFYHYQDVTQFSQMGAKPVADQMRISYQPVLLSWEMWTPQVYAGATVHAIAHIVNDARDGSDLRGATLHYEMVGKDGVVRLRGSSSLPFVPYYGAKSQSIALTIPAAMPGGEYLLRGHILRGGAEVSANSVSLYVAAHDPVPAAAGRAAGIAVYDPAGKTARALRKLGIPITLITNVGAVPAGHALVIGENAWDGTLSKQQGTLKKMALAGSHILLLRQAADILAKNAGWLGTDLRFTSAKASSGSGMYINPERPEHPVFQGVPRRLLHTWSDPTGWDETKPGLPAICPVSLCFQAAHQDDLARTAVLADFGRGLSETALGEVFAGRGSILISGFDLTARSGLDPIADRLLRNLVSYTSAANGHYARPLIASPIVWGDYHTERGLVGGPQYGLLVNEGEVQIPNPAAPGLSSSQEVPHGRRAFGPFSYNGNCHIVDDNPSSPTGSGVFFARVPAGSGSIVTRVSNPSKTIAAMTVELNGKAGEAVSIAPGQEASITTPIPDNVTEIAVRFTGGKELVLLQTEVRNRK